uniref:B30.2/SPRY domain-containing protein n=1 Tax=Pundamilia nyererei TaxID=303518 RepID=A0A3B4GAY4_9CICH
MQSSSCRLTHGVQQGRVGFEVRLERKLLTAQPDDHEVREPYGLRVGWSVAVSSMLLGEDELSFCYDGRGKKVSDRKEENFGEPFSEGDIIGCYASFSSDGAVELSFHKNGRFVGVAFSTDTSVLRGRALFPHVLCKSFMSKELRQNISLCCSLSSYFTSSFCFQCNILFSALRHKLRLFTGFRRRVVVVFPSGNEWKRRLSQHQMRDGEHIPETALLKLQGLPTFELQYVELPQEKALKLLQEYKDEARRLLPPVPKHEKTRRLYRKRPHPHGPPSSHRSGMQTWSQPPRYVSYSDSDSGGYNDNFNRARGIMTALGAVA